MVDSPLPPEQIRLPPSPTDPEPLTHGHSSGEVARSKLLGDATPIPPLSPNFLAPPRNRSPLSRIHTRSRSLAGPIPQSMTRAHSSPGLDSRGRYIFPSYVGRPSSPMDRSIRRNSPLRTAEDTKIPSLASLNISETISEHAELENAHGADSIDSELQATSPPLPPSMHHTFPRSTRRQPVSPLYTNFSSIISNPTSSPTSSHSSPVIMATRFNEPFPGVSGSSASSIPSTPTSLRSRSPSISSLETIPDIPDAEAAAVEADRIAQLKQAADNAEAGAGANADSTRRRSNFDSSSPGGMRGSIGYGTRADKRKRWSVCGAERRQDFDLETIWED
ncbi:hypothetical protein VTN77DRAFT_7251 [Rasamsonia byssochlamydoides]|uniref:uncharacterized protein n=1 Tax=Rasamsonia byssochlamydoides TaxID=89139 RepID=UPI0037433A66